MDDTSYDRCHYNVVNGPFMTHVTPPVCEQIRHMTEWPFDLYSCHSYLGVLTRFIMITSSDISDFGSGSLTV